MLQAIRVLVRLHSYDQRESDMFTVILPESLVQRTPFSTCPIGYVKPGAHAHEARSVVAP